MIYLPHSPFSFLCHRRRAQRGTESGLVWGSSSFVSCFKSHSTYWKADPDFYFPSPERETVTSLSLHVVSDLSGRGRRTQSTAAYFRPTKFAFLGLGFMFGEQNLIMFSLLEMAVAVTFYGT